MSDPIDPDTHPALDPETPPGTAPTAPSSDGTPHAPDASPNESDPDAATVRPVEIGGQKGPEPTRYGDWEKKGRCTDF